MSRRIFQDDRMPWSFFLPMTMAVVVGVLIADGVRYAVGEVFAARTATGARAPASPAAPDPVATAQEATVPETSVDAASATVGSAATGQGVPTSPSAISSAPSAQGPTTLVAPAAIPGPSGGPQAAPSVVGIERLPGSIGARRDDQPRACINGTVALRDRNGWQQELSADRPVRCEQSEP